MSPTAAALRRRHPVAGVAVAIGVALATVVVANGATSDAGTVPSRSTGPPPVSSLVSDCASMGTVLSAAVAGTAPGAGPDAASGARGRAAAVARSTTSDDVREPTQNLADDLAAYRVAVASPASAEQAARRADIGVMVRDDLAALRRLCKR
ncbi:hypothetical protein [Intrasporangium sp. YIM S08009]|uniref:hypothetical protein n=1 Tax=Intrasporangium zincisolvens TaxID=3080018 RepID=UPI002B05FB75|nr:hypothetical protein [Intrasporangium sp. YIM S08009]